MNGAAKRYADEKLKEAYKVWYLPLIKYCNVRMGEARVSADDCVQEAFLVYYNKMLSGEEIENPRAFLYRTADNFLKRAVANFSRELKNTVPLDSAQEVAADVFIPDCSDYDYLAEKILAILSSEERQLYKAKYIENQSLAQIAETFNLSSAAAAKRASRLRRKIKDEIKRYTENNSEGGI